MVVKEDKSSSSPFAAARVLENIFQFDIIESSKTRLQNEIRDGDLILIMERRQIDLLHKRK